MLQNILNCMGRGSTECKCVKTKMGKRELKLISYLTMLKGKWVNGGYNQFIDMTL